MRVTLKLPSICNGHVKSQLQKIRSNGRVLIEKDLLVKPAFLSVAKSRATIPTITVESESRDVLNECSGFTIDNEGFILAPEYLAVPKPQDREKPYKLYATFITLKHLLPPVSDKYIVHRYGVEGVVEIKVPLRELWKDANKDIVLLKIDLDNLQDPWPKIPCDSHSLRPGNSIYMVNQNTISEGQFMHFNTKPEFSYITSNNINRGEIGSPGFDDKGNFVGMASRIQVGFMNRVGSVFNMLAHHAFPERLVRQLTYVIGYFPINNFLKEKTGMEFYGLREGTLMSSDKVSRAVRAIAS